MKYLFKMIIDKWVLEPCLNQHLIIKHYLLSFHKNHLITLNGVPIMSNISNNLLDLSNPNMKNHVTRPIFGLYLKDVSSQKEGLKAEAFYFYFNGAQWGDYEVHPLLY